MWLLLMCPPTGDLALNPGMCPDWESNQWPFGLQNSIQPTVPHQLEQFSGPLSYKIFWYICILSHCICILIIYYLNYKTDKTVFPVLENFNKISVTGFFIVFFPLAFVPLIPLSPNTSVTVFSKNWK